MVHLLQAEISGQSSRYLNSFSEAAWQRQLSGSSVRSGVDAPHEENCGLVPLQLAVQSPPLEDCCGLPASRTQTGGAASHRE